MKYRHGQYYLENKKGYFLFNSYLRRGRAFVTDKYGKSRVLDIEFKTHPKLVKGILERGERIISPSELKRKK